VGGPIQGACEDSFGKKKARCDKRGSREGVETAPIRRGRNIFLCFRIRGGGVDPAGGGVVLTNNPK